VRRVSTTAMRKALESLEEVKRARSVKQKGRGATARKKTETPPAGDGKEEGRA